MFGLSFSHLVLLAIIALIVIGPQQLPEVARTIARFINELKRTTQDFTRTPIVEDREIPRPPPPPKPAPPIALDDPQQMSFDMTQRKSPDEH